MCLITNQKKPRITKRDRVVYKIVNIDINGSISSHFMRFTWQKGELYKQSFKDIMQMYPSRAMKFDSIVARAYKKEELDGRKVTIIGVGFHASLTRKRLTDFIGIIQRFLIPKGSKIFTDKTGLIVSNQMMML